VGVPSKKEGKGRGVLEDYNGTIVPTPGLVVPLLGRSVLKPRSRKRGAGKKEGSFSRNKTKKQVNSVGKRTSGNSVPEKPKTGVFLGGETLLVRKTHYPT